MPKTIDELANEPVRKTEGGRYGENSELMKTGVDKTSLEEVRSRHYFTNAKRRNKGINDTLDRMEKGE